MHEYYSDIIDRLGEPRWFDECACPRYCKFSPRRLSNIYADECCLVLIKCQDCGYEFKVAFSQSTMDKVRHIMMFGKDKEMPTIADGIRDKTLHYGDPPNVECCAAGPTMNCDDVKVLEYWERKTDMFNWKRDKSLEIELEG